MPTKDVKIFIKLPMVLSSHMQIVFGGTKKFLGFIQNENPFQSLYWKKYFVQIIGDNYSISRFRIAFKEILTYKQWEYENNGKKWKMSTEFVAIDWI